MVAKHHNVNMLASKHYADERDFCFFSWGFSFFEIFEVDQPEHPFDQPVDDDPRPNDALLVVNQAGPV